ncbi:MAG: MFS transporter [Gammaproteobacteria bacterium]|nr:MFS transporter [Gammaproteobacteria bacterium]
MRSAQYFINKRILSLLILLLCASFLFYKYILQVFPGIITTELMQEYHLTGVGLGNLAATFYYAYMIMQLFVGILLDKWSTRKLTSAAILVCGIGTIAFSQSHTAMTAGISRFMMGVGVSFSTVAYLKVAALWFPANRYALVSGLLATAAMAGAIFGEAPLSFFMNSIGWRPALLYVGYGGVILALLFWLIVRDSPVKTTVKTAPIVLNWRAIAAVLTNRQNWLLTLYSGLAFSPLAILGGLWGNPFIQELYHLDATSAGSLVSLSFIGLGLGSPLLGALADYTGHRLVLMFYSTALSLVSICFVIYWPGLPLWLASTLFLSFGFFLGGFMLAFTVGKEMNRLALAGTVIAMINASDAFLDAITEPAIGKFLDWRSGNVLVNGAYHFTVTDYRYALSILPIYLFLSLLCLVGLKRSPNAAQRNLGKDI